MRGKETFSRRLKEEANRELFRGLEFHEGLKNRVRRLMRKEAPRRVPRRWIWALPALGIGLLRPSSPSPAPPHTLSLAPELKPSPEAAGEQQPASLPTVPGVTVGEQKAASAQAEASPESERKAETPSESPYQTVEIAGARVTVGPLLFSHGNFYLPVQVEVTDTGSEPPAPAPALLAPQRWTFRLLTQRDIPRFHEQSRDGERAEGAARAGEPAEGESRADYGTPAGDRSRGETGTILQPEEVKRNPTRWEGRLKLPGEWKEDFPLRLEVMFDDQRREMIIAPP